MDSGRTIYLLFRRRNPAKTLKRRAGLFSLAKQRRSRSRSSALKRLTYSFTETAFDNGTIARRGLLPEKRNKKSNQIQID
jgi:hypothetical protein